LIALDHSYSNLKKIIYQVEKDLVAARAPSSDAESGAAVPDERTGLLTTSKITQAKARANSLFLPALDKELEKIVTFYYKKERDLYAEVEALASDVEFVENFDPSIPARFAASTAAGNGKNLSGASVRKGRTRQNSRASRRSISGRSGTWRYDEAVALADAAAANPSTEAAPSTGGEPHPPTSPHGNQPGSSSEITTAEAPTTVQADQEEEEDDNDDDDAKSLWFEPEMEHERMRYRHNCIEMFVNLSELQAYAKLNSTGFTKILKKYDKISENSVKKVYINQVVLQAYPFKQETTAKLQEQIDRVTAVYARIFTNGDQEVAKRSLRMHLKEHMVWERNTIWRDMIGIERKSQAVGVRPSSALKKEPITINTPCGSIQFPEFLTRDVLVMAFCCVVFAVLLQAELFEDPALQNCFAILIFASLLWATEVRSWWDKKCLYDIFRVGQMYDAISSP